MFTLAKTFRFEASHILPHHDGKCARLHGHSWVATVEVEAETLRVTGPQQGMAVDFWAISTAVRPLLESHLDHYHLNDSLGLENPTSEQVAKWIFERLPETIGGARLVRVKVEETCTSAAEYAP